MSTGIVAFAFGSPESLAVNHHIARQAFAEAWHHKGVVFTQADVPMYGPFRIERAEETPGNPPSTMQLAHACARWAKENGLMEVRIVAAPPHMWRARRDVQRALREQGLHPEVVVCTWNQRRFPKESWFSSASAQARTRSRTLFWAREILLRLMPFPLYQAITG